MGLNDTPEAERKHIGIFGCRNAGKSSLVNAVASQQLSIVSEQPGTTTDPVRKAMELLPAGPVVLVDTAGIDDVGELGALRIKKSLEALRRSDLAVFVTGSDSLNDVERSFVERFKKLSIPYIIVRSKTDIKPVAEGSEAEKEGWFRVSSASGEGVRELKEAIAEKLVRDGKGGSGHIVADLIEPGDVVVLVIPIDSSAPKGRLILPQQMVIRDVLDSGGICVSSRDTEYAAQLSALKEPPRLVITDSQAFKSVAAQTPPGVELTSFSILMARYKGVLEQSRRALEALSSIQDGDRILISEGCTHHRQCEDIGSVKIPGWIRSFCHVNPEFHFTSGREFPEDLSAFKLIVHCGGCMLNEREMKYRMKTALEQGVPMTNYGVLIAHLNGVKLPSNRY